MAGTICDFKSFLANLPPEPVERVASSVRASEPPTFTPALPKTQATIIPPSLEALTASMVRLVDAACEVHSDSTGATVSLTDGDMVGQKLFAVSIYAERSVGLPARPTWQNIFAFVWLNVDLLVKPGHAFGLWFDKSEHTYVLDVVICLSSRRTALELGRMFGEKSIYALATRQVIVIKARRVRPASVCADLSDRSDSFEKSLLEATGNRTTEATTR